MTDRIEFSATTEVIGWQGPLRDYITLLPFDHDWKGRRHEEVNVTIERIKIPPITRWEAEEFLRDWLLGDGVKQDRIEEFSKRFSSNGGIIVEERSV